MPFSRSISRFLWYCMLWVMRRPWMKELRRRSPMLLPESRRAQAWERIKAQDQWAMRHGKGILQFLVSLLMASAFVNAVYLGLITYWR